MKATGLGLGFTGLGLARNAGLDPNSSPQNTFSFPFRHCQLAKGQFGIYSIYLRGTTEFQEIVYHFELAGTLQ